jgi:hypothetical protein
MLKVEIGKVSNEITAPYLIKIILRHLFFFPQSIKGGPKVTLTPLTQYF